MKDLTNFPSEETRAAWLKSIMAYYEKHELPVEEAFNVGNKLVAALVCATPSQRARITEALNASMQAWGSDWAVAATSEAEVLFQTFCGYESSKLDTLLAWAKGQGLDQSAVIRYFSESEAEDLADLSIGELAEQLEEGINPYRENLAAWFQEMEDDDIEDWKTRVLDHLKPEEPNAQE